LKPGKIKTKSPVKEAAVPKPPAQARNVTVVCVALVLACAAIYGRTLSHGFLDYDDPLAVTGNSMAQAGLSWAGLLWAFTTDRATYMMPVTWLSHMTDCELYGLQPWGHHLTNILIHSVNSVLLFLVFARITRRLWPSALVAALFAVHPLHVEAVAWIAERKGLLNMLFWTAALGAYAWHRKRPGLARYLLVSFLFVLGLMSKPMMVTLPFALLLLDFWPLDQIDRAESLGVMARKTARLAVGKLPLLLLTVPFSVLAFTRTMQDEHVDAYHWVSLADRCANAVIVYALYPIQTVWPSGLAAYYPYPTAYPAWRVAGAGVILVAVTLFSLRHALRHPYLIVGWLWYLGTLVPVIGLVGPGNFSRADRYTYIPLIGIFIMIAWGGADLVAVWRLPKRAVALATGGALAILAVCSAVQVGYWRDTETLFRRALAVGQESVFAYDVLWVLALQHGRYDEARTCLTKSLELVPENPVALDSLGLLDLDQQRYDEAGACLTKALKLDPGNVAVLDHLGKLAMKLGRHDEANAWLTKALDRDPGYVDALYNMGALAMDRERPGEARSWLTKALDRDPGMVDALNDMGLLALYQGRFEEAGAWLAKALGRNPKCVNALNNRGLLALYQRHFDEARPWLEKALALNPEHVNALNNLGWCLLNQNQYERARKSLQKALELDPQNTKAMLNLGDTLDKLGRHGEAEAHRRKAAELGQSKRVGTAGGQ
jgi:tetratricopeptide (TPR) repeat protein